MHLSLYDMTYRFGRLALDIQEWCINREDRQQWGWRTLSVAMAVAVAVAVAVAEAKAKREVGANSK